MRKKKNVQYIEYLALSISDSFCFVCSCKVMSRRASLALRELSSSFAALAARSRAEGSNPCTEAPPEEEELPFPLIPFSSLFPSLPVASSLLKIYTFNSCGYAYRDERDGESAVGDGHCK